MTFATTVAAAFAAVSSTGSGVGVEVGNGVDSGGALGVGVGGGVDVGGAGTPAATVVARTRASIVACAFGVFVGIIEVAVGTAVGGAGMPAATVVARTRASIVACLFGVFVDVSLGSAVEVAVGCVSCTNCGGRDNPCIDA